MTPDGRLLANRLTDLAAVALVGDGVLGFLLPEQRVRLWFRGPDWWERAVAPFRHRPGVVRLLAAAETAAGVWLAARGRAR